MPVTRAQVEGRLVRLYGAKLTLVGRDGATADGTNADLDGPIAAGLASLKCYPADGLTVVDADLAAVAPADLPQLLDVAGLACLEVVLANWAEPDQMADTDNSQALGKLYDSLEKTAARLRKDLAALYGYGRGRLSSGTLDLGFAETRCDWGRGW